LGRVTVTLDERDHLAFKLLALQKDEKLIILIQDAMQQYLEREGAYDLSIRSGTDASKWIMNLSNDDDHYRIDPSKLPKQLDIDLPSALEEQLLKLAARTGRSVDELILEILDQYLRDRWPCDLLIKKPQRIEPLRFIVLAGGSMSADLAPGWMLQDCSLIDLPRCSVWSASPECYEGLWSWSVLETAMNMISGHWFAVP
jgi:hypothetical protein